MASPAAPAERRLLSVGAAQLLVQLVGMGVAVRRRLPYDVELVAMRGEPDEMGRDVWDTGTALSAPIQMLGMQAGALGWLATRDSTVARRILGGLGALNVAGYLGERVVRERLRPGGWDPVETPVAGLGVTLAAAMGVLGLRPSSRATGRGLDDERRGRDAGCVQPLLVLRPRAG